MRRITTLVLFLVYVGYLAFRRVPADPQVRARRAAVIGIVGALQIPIVRYSVQWWENNTLHQQASLTDGNLENLTLFTWFVAQVVLGAVFLWLLVHRFRVAWLLPLFDNIVVFHKGNNSDRGHRGVSRFAAFCVR